MLFLALAAVCFFPVSSAFKWPAEPEPQGLLRHLSRVGGVNPNMPADEAATAKCE